MKVKKTFRVVIITVVIFIVGGIGGLFFSKYLIPALGKCAFFEKRGFFQDMEKNTTIINKTETVVVREDNLIGEISSGAISSTVTVFSFYDDAKAKKGTFSEQRNIRKTGKRRAGAILTNDGMVVTYGADTVKEGTVYKVAIFDGSVYDAKLIGVDDFTNLVFLHIEGINLPAISFANSDDVNLGKKVIAIGYSSGRDKVSLTEGVLSAFDPTFNLSGQSVASSEKLEGVFKADFGDDKNYIGGPIIDFNGEMLALTGSLDIDNKEVYFQIPINVVKTAMNRVAEGKAEKMAKLGVYYISIDTFEQELYDLPVEKGAMIFSSSGQSGLAILAGSPAEKAGLKLNDIVLAIDDKEIDLKHPLSLLVSQYQEGDSATFKILRNDEEINISVEF